MKSRMKSALNHLNEERGSVFPMVLILLLLGALMIPPLLSMVGTGIVSGSMYREESEELYAADAGATDALWLLARNTPGEMEALMQSDDDGDPEKYTYDLPDPINSKTVQYEITIDDIDADVYVIKSTATGPEGSSTTIEVRATHPYDPPVVLFAAAAMDGDLTVNAADLGSPSVSLMEGEDVGTGNGVNTYFELDELLVKNSQVEVTVNGEPLTQGYSVDYYNNRLVFDPPPIGPIMATYNYYSGRVNIYADGDIYFQGSVEAYVDCWITPGHDVYVDNRANWIGEKIYTFPLDIVGSYMPERPDTIYPPAGGDVLIDTNIGQLGSVRITGGLIIRQGAVIELTGTVWVDGNIDITSGIVTGTDLGDPDDPNDDRPYWIVSDSTDVHAVDVNGGSIDAILYANSSDIDTAGNPVINGSVISQDYLDITGSGNLQNNLPLYLDLGGMEGMDILAWKII